MMKRIYLFLIALIPLILYGQPNITMQEVGNGFVRVTDIENAGDSRLFVVEQDGRIRILNSDGSSNPAPFLDISAMVDTSHNERGLLGLTFHPNYATNGYFYVNYTALPDGQTHISRFTVTADSNIADPTSEMIILSYRQPFGNHNAGDINFGPDGYLYIPLGDGGSGGDPEENAQSDTTLLGKLLRIDVDGGSPYAIPPSNPFVSDPNVRDEIWAFGLRNPYRFSFDRATGDMWLPDVGQNVLEEINFVPSGNGSGWNFGWDCYEGDQVFEPAGCGPASDYIFPVMTYWHDSTGGCAIIGGFRYRGMDYPAMEGHYFFTDHCAGRLWSMIPDGVGGWDTVSYGADTSFMFTTFGEGFDGELYLAQRGGRILKITADPIGIEEPASVQGITIAPNPFTGQTTISIDVNVAGKMEVAIYNVMGEKVKALSAETAEQGSTSHRYTWNGRDEQNQLLPAGMYYVVVKGNETELSKAIVLTR